MKYQPPYGVSDENASYIDGNPALGIVGSAVPAKALEHTMREIVNVITEAGLTPDENNLKQLALAIDVLIKKAMPEKQEIYELCEFYHFRQPVLRPGFQPAQGGLLANAAEQYPDAWAYLKTAEGQRLCKTESEWQALTTATWATLADGTQVGWGGIGGAPFYVQNTANGTLRLPDLRGMYAEAAGYDSLDVGGAHGDAARNIVGETGAVEFLATNATGPFEDATAGHSGIYAPAGVRSCTRLRFKASRVVPTANKNQPRAWGALACVYLGAPR